MRLTCAWLVRCLTRPVRCHIVTRVAAVLGLVHFILSSVLFPWHNACLVSQKGGGERRTCKTKASPTLHSHYYSLFVIVSLAVPQVFPYMIMASVPLHDIGHSYMFHDVAEAVPRAFHFIFRHTSLAQGLPRFATGRRRMVFPHDDSCRMARLCRRVFDSCTDVCVDMCVDMCGHRTSQWCRCAYDMFTDVFVDKCSLTHRHVRG